MALNEVRIASRHCQQTDHLVALIDAYYHDGKICLLQEYCDGGSLEDAFASAQLIGGGGSTLPLGPIVLQVLNGLGYMHREMKQVHRDLKPANVLLTSQGVVKLSDFGISKQLDSTQAVAMTQVGTTAYMAPERLKGDEYSFSSDVWAVGVIVLEALIGAHPFAEHKSFMSLFKAITSGTLPEAPGTTPKAARDLAAACLQLDATDRPSVSALLESDWLRPIGSQDSRQPVFQWLVKEAAAATKAKARAMAAKAIATSAEEAEGAEGGGETLA